MLKPLEKRFPHWQAVIKRLRQSDPDFRAVCREYEETAKALDFWVRLSKQAMRQIDRQKLACKELLQELETEIRMTLEQQEKESTSRGERHTSL